MWEFAGAARRLGRAKFEQQCPVRARAPPYIQCVFIHTQEKTRIVGSSVWRRLALRVACKIEAIARGRRIQAIPMGQQAPVHVHPSGVVRGMLFVSGVIAGLNSLFFDGVPHSFFVAICEPNRNIPLRPNAEAHNRKHKDFKPAATPWASATFPQQPHGSPTYIYIYIYLRRCPASRARATSGRSRRHNHAITP
jgi:hypothetical protein